MNSTEIKIQMISLNGHIKSLGDAFDKLVGIVSTFDDLVNMRPLSKQESSTLESLLESLLLAVNNILMPDTANQDNFQPKLHTEFNNIIKIFEHIATYFLQVRKMYDDVIKVLPQVVEPNKRLFSALHQLSIGIQYVTLTNNEIAENIGRIRKTIVVKYGLLECL